MPILSPVVNPMHPLPATEPTTTDKADHEATDTTDKTEATDTTDKTEATDSAESTKKTDKIHKVDSTDTTQKTEATDVAESIQKTEKIEKNDEPADTTQNTDTTENTSPPPVVKPNTGIQPVIGIEKNFGIEDEQNEVEQNGVEQNKVEQKEQAKSDVIMYNEYAPPMLPPKHLLNDPFAIPDIPTGVEKAVVLNIAGDPENKSGPKNVMTYVRGKMTPKEADVADANVVGGRNTYVDTENSDVLSASAAAFHGFLRFASVAFAGISVALLLFFHFVSLDANLLWVNAAWSPNTWEFLFYVGYLQQMQATSELTLLKTPYFLLDYTDSFAWSNFLIQVFSSDQPESRRLETIVLDGLVSYSDRIGISENSILVQGATGFAVVMGIVLVVFLVLAVLAKRKAEQALDESSDLNSYTSGVHRLRSVSIRALGLCVLIWYFALYPLSMLASFEISMEKQASTVANALVVAIIALVLVCFGVLAVAGRVIMQKTKDELEQFENLATWGSLYCEYTYRSRMFFVIDVVVQITTGVLVGCLSGDPTQLIVVIAIQVLYLACVFIMSPFADPVVLRITYALGLLKVLNFSLAFAFLNSNSMSALARTHVAQAYIGINSIVILVWFVRQLIVFSTYIRAWMVYFNDESRRSHSVVKYVPRTDTESDMWASQFNGFNDSRQNNSRLNQSVNSATLSMPPNSMQPSYASSPANSMQTNSLVSAQQSMGPSFGSEAQFQQQMARKYEIDF
ncbi:hypothetical protein KXD40_000692 [Peronospora effusa]|nr:hypothetical protein KXD40_000692 [Peronospora effusa]